MRRTGVIFVLFVLMAALAACGMETVGDSDGNIPTVVRVQSDEQAITEIDAVSCVIMSNESWYCYGENLEDGKEVSVDVAGFYYVSELEDASFPVSSVEILDVRFGDSELVPVQTGSREQAVQMLADFGYGKSEYLFLQGEPLVVFYFEGTGSGIYREDYTSVDTPIVISYCVVFENGQELIMEFSDSYVGVGAYGVLEINEDSFDLYQ